MCNNKVYWLLDCRFDFLLNSFMRKFGIEKEDLILVNSYHGSMREQWNRKHVYGCDEYAVIQMEPDDLNRIFSSMLSFDRVFGIVAFSGIGIPKCKELFLLTAVGNVAEMCNDKWWQYQCFSREHILTPYTVQCCDLSVCRYAYERLMNQYGKLIIKKRCLSGGYQMAVLSNKNDLEFYCRNNGFQNILLSAYIPHQQSFAAMGVVRKDGRIALIDEVTEQVLYQDTAYEGLLFPAFLDVSYQDEIRCMTEKIGKMLSRAGYFGFYNVDYILGTDGCLYVSEVNARLGFGTILAACLYGENFWDLMQGEIPEKTEYFSRRLMIGKIKAREGRVYSGLKSRLDILEWFQRKEGGFQTFFCGTDGPQRVAYGSYIGLFGEFVSEEETRETVLHKFWDRCIEYYDDTN